MVTDGRGHLPASSYVVEHIVCDRDSSLFYELISEKSRRGWDVVADCICYQPEQAMSLITAIHGLCNHVIVVSTGILYANDTVQPCSVDARLAADQCLGAYALGKKRMESTWLSSANDTPVTILRPAHIVGRGSHLGIVPLHNRDATLINRIRGGRPLLLADEGDQQVQIIDARDLSRVIVKSAGNQKLFGEVYNCANPRIFSAWEYYAAVATAMNRPLHIKGIPSSLVNKSVWGWDLTLRSWTLQTSELEFAIGMIANTPLNRTITDAVRYAKQTDGFVLPDRDILSPVEAAVSRQDSAATLVALNHAALRRHRTATDLRMNAVLGVDHT